MRTANRIIGRTLLTIAILLSVQLRGPAAALPEGATILDPNLLWDLEPDWNGATDIQDPVFAISPDDKRIAYISRGAIWSCNVTAGPPTKLVDLPNTKTALLASPDYEGFWQSVLAARNSRAYTKYEGRIPNAVGVHSLAWTHNQDGLLYTLSKPSADRPWTVVYQTMHVLNERSVQPLCKFERDAYDKPHRLYSFATTRDLQHVVASDGYSPLIITAATGKPRATCFDCLVPSSTSNRFLGIEIDTRQLVVADAAFNVIKRFDVICNPQRHFELFWSPDERYALCREHLEHPSSDWIGIRIDLASGEKRGLESAHKIEQCLFTGRGAELIRIGALPTAFGATYIAVVPDGADPQYDIVRWPNVQRLDSTQQNGRYPAVRMSRDGQLFAMAFPREGRSPGYRYFLVDRNGTKWSCGPDDQSRRVSPYHVVAITNASKTVIACDDTRLFSIPVEVVKNAEPPIAP